MSDNGTKMSEMSGEVPAVVPQVPVVRHDGAVAVGAAATGALMLGAVAVGAVAIGALAISRLAISRLAISRLAIGQLAVGRARLRTSEADEVRITRLIIGELRIEQGSR